MNKKRHFIYQQALVLFMVLCSVWGWGQISLTGTSYSQNFDGLSSGLPAGWSVKTGATSNSLGDDVQLVSSSSTNSAWASTAGNFRNAAAAESPMTSSSNANSQFAAIDRAIAVRPSGSFADPGAAIMLEIANTTGKRNFTMSVKHMLMDPQGRTTVFAVQYTNVNTETSGWKTIGTFSTNGTWGATVGNYSFGSSLDNLSNTVRIRVVALSASTGSGSRDTYGIDDFQLNWENIPTCTTPTYLFNDEVVAKTTNDPAFTNEFLSDNQSPTVYASSNSSVATVDQSTGLVTIVGAGSTTISVTQVADGTYCAVNASYTLNVISSSPQLSISGVPTNHGSSCVGVLNSVVQYTITNNGGGAASNVAVSSDNTQFVVSNLSSTSIAAGGTATFNVTFTPSGAGAQGATITVTGTGSNSPTLALTGTGTATVSPVLATQTASAVADTGATLNGNLSSLGTCLSSPLTEKGFVYGTASSPELNGGIFAAVGAVTAGAYNLALTSLLPATQYYYKSYVKDANGQFVYGLEQTFTTVLNAPVATAATNVAPVGFTANWNAVNGAESYKLEVNEVSGSVTPNVTVVGWDFEDQNAAADAGTTDNLNKLISENADSAPSHGRKKIPANFFGVRF